MSAGKGGRLRRRKDSGLGKRTRVITELHSLYIAFGAHAIAHYSFLNSHSTNISWISPSQGSCHFIFTTVLVSHSRKTASPRGQQLAVELEVLVPSPRALCCARGRQSPHSHAAGAVRVRCEAEAWFSRKKCLSPVQNWVTDSWQPACRLDHSTGRKTAELKSSCEQTHIPLGTLPLPENTP